MRRSLLIGLVWFGMALAVAQAVPARPAYAPPPPEAVLDFRNSRWVGKTYEQQEWVIILEAKGSVTGTDSGTKIYGNWTANGTAVYIELHDKFYEFRGAVKGEILEGDSSNITGMRWKTT